MIHWLLRTLGVEDERPVPGVRRFPPSEAEFRYECVRQGAEEVIVQADRETARVTHDLRAPLASVRMEDDDA